MALRLSSGLGLLLLFAYGIGMLEQALVASLVMPAFFVGGVDVPSPRWGLRSAWVIVCFTAITAITAELSVSAPQWLTLWFALIGFVFTSLGALGVLSARLGMGTLAVAALGMAVAGLYPSLQLGLSFGLVSGWLIGYSAIWYQLTDQMPLRQALAATYRRLAYILAERPKHLLDRRVPVHFDEQLGQDLSNARMLLNSISNDRNKGPLQNAFMAALDLQERLQALPEPDVVSNMLATEQSFPVYNAWARAMAARLHRIARELERGHSPSRSDATESYTSALEAELFSQQMQGGKVAMVANYLISNARQIDRLLQRVAPLYQRPITGAQRYPAWQQWREAMHWDNPVMRGSVRMALLLAVASEIASLMPFDNGFWIMLTISVVWQSSYIAIRSRVWHRAMGTLAGVVIAMLLFALGVEGNGALAMAFLFAPLTLAAVTKHHGWTTTGVTVILMMALAYLELAGPEVMFARLVDTLIGCGLIFIAYRFLWPQWQGGRQRLLRQQAVRVLADYWKPLLASFAGEAVEPLQLAQARRLAYEQGIAMNSSLTQMRQEPGYGANMLNSSTLLAHFKGSMHHLNAIVPQARKGMLLAPEDNRQLQQLFSQLETVLLAASHGDIQPWPPKLLAAEQWLLERLANSSADRSSFVLYQFSLLLQRCHGIHQILCLPAPKGKARLRP
ncbi:FUSC family protein [Ferrimonas senticii]|uniref:FUSC family protein n=1 Tax=Ferrimonas senticii TaxID=394566 RepID=UPI000404AF09|nr:FUSC family protein [Ferrimonas senticii]